MLRKFTVLFMLFSFSPVLKAGAGNVSEASGLLFKTGQELIESRTSLDLYNGNFQKMSGSFSIRFDISIWDINSFGYIFRLVNKKQEEMSLVFVPYRGGDSLYFDFNSNVTTRSVHIPVLKSSIKKGLWIPILMQFDLSKDEAVVTIQEKSYHCPHAGFHNPDSFKFIFGLYGINLDVVTMALRNIVITKNNGKEEVFPLNESEGNLVYDSKGVAKGYVKNPVWLAKKHYEWEKTAEFTADKCAGIAYDSNTGEALAISPDSMTVFDANTHSLNTEKTVRIPFKIVSGEAIYDSIKNCCYIYSFDDAIYHRPSFSTIDFNAHPPLVTSGTATVGNRLHHHDVFLSDDGEDLYVFGGYAKFTYFNTFYKFNPTEYRWDPQVFTGDTICPRFFAASGKGINPNSILIYGGFGNQSGKQELGGRNLYDLYQVDLTSKTIKKLWEQHLTDELFVPCGNLILDKDKNYFYTLCYPHHIAKTELKLYKFSIKDGLYEIVSNAIPILSEKIESEAFLFFDQSLQEFIAVTREYVDPEKSEIRIYSLSSPPVSLSRLNTAHPSSGISGYLLAAFAFLLLIAGFVYFTFFLRKKKRNEAATVNEVPDGIPYPEIVQPVQEEKQFFRKYNALYLLGDFTAFDKNGRDISYRFSLKLQSLLAAVLLSQHTEDGISTQKLTSNLWPDRKIKNAKDIRGVTINHLRNILEDMEGIQLVYDNSKWAFSVGDDFYCDYLHSLKIIAGTPETNISGESIQQLAGLVKRGSLFRNTEAEWIDDYKQKYEATVEQLLISQLQTEYNQGNCQHVLNLSDALFVIDPLNEDVLSVTVRILKKSGKIEYSQNLYNRFSLRYKAVMGEEYPVKYSFL